MFRELISSNVNSTLDPKKISIYPISEYNLEGIKILYDNSLRMCHDNTNTHTASVNPSIWMGDVLDKHWRKISYVCASPSFTIIKVEDNNIVEKSYTAKLIKLDTDDELDAFFEKGSWKKFVIFYIIRYVDLVSLNPYYTIKYADITEKFEERDNKINSILDTDKKNI